MAQQVVLTMVDDLDGGKANETVMFGIDGATYEIDLKKSNATKLRKALDEYIAAGRRVTRKGRAPKARTRTGTRADPATVRAWAFANDLPISSRGRIARGVVEQYHAAALSRWALRRTRILN
jgi:hypothetical protein